MRRVIPFSSMKEFAIIDIFEPCLDFANVVFLHFGYQTRLVKTRSTANNLEDIIVETIESEDIGEKVLLIDVFEDGLINKIKKKLSGTKSEMIIEFAGFEIGGIKLYRYLLYAIIISDILVAVGADNTDYWLEEFRIFISSSKYLSYEDFKDFIQRIIRNNDSVCNVPLISHLIINYLDNKGRIALLCSNYLLDKLRDIELMLAGDHPLSKNSYSTEEIVDYYLKKDG